MKPFIFALLVAIACQSCKTPPNTSALTDTHEDSLTWSELRFLQRRIDFGKVAADTLLIARYTFINTGSKQLQISEINPDCTCTGFYLSRKTILPGDSAYILLKYSTKGKSGESKVYATVTANTRTRLYSLEVVANVVDR